MLSTSCCSERITSKNTRPGASGRNFDEDHRTDGTPTQVCVPFHVPVAHDGVVQRGVKLPVDVVTGNEFLERNGDPSVESPMSVRIEHGRLRDCECNAPYAEEIPWGNHDA